MSDSTVPFVVKTEFVYNLFTDGNDDLVDLMYDCQNEIRYLVETYMEGLSSSDPFYVDVRPSQT